MNRKLCIVSAAVALAAGCGSSTQPAHTQKTHHPAVVTSASPTADPVAEGACRKIDAAVAAIPQNPERIQVEVAARPVAAAAGSVAGVVPLGTDAAKLGADMAKVIADTSITSDSLNADLSAVAADCGTAGYMLHHATIG